MKRNSSTGVRLKGLFLRGKKFWYRCSHEGHQYRVPLETENEAEALTKAFRIRNNPILAGADPLAQEIKTYLATKRELKVILSCGFHAGMRKDEIVQARPGWFDIKLSTIHITQSETWKPKDKDKRTIPLMAEFGRFLVEEMSLDGKLPEPFAIFPLEGISLHLSTRHHPMPDLFSFA
jgi:integrase